MANRNGYSLVYDSVHDMVKQTNDKRVEAVVGQLHPNIQAPVVPPCFRTDKGFEVHDLGLPEQRGSYAFLGPVRFAVHVFGTEHGNLAVNYTATSKLVRPV